MALPAPTSPIWTEIISGKKQVQFDFLAVKIFLGSAQVRYKKDAGAAAQISKELYELFEKNANLPSAQRDLQKLS